MNVAGMFQKLNKKYAPKIKELKLTFYILKNNPLAIFGIGVIIITILCALFASYIAPYDPYQLNMAERFSPPTLAHPFGTDALGRDVLSRVIFGFRVSFLAGVIVVGVGVCIGGPMGLIAGYKERIARDIMMRITDIFLAFPTVVLAIALASALGPSLWNALLAMSIVYWPRYARLFYGQTLSIKENEYVKFAELIGERHMRIIFRHIIPNTFSAVLVQATLDLGDAILVVAVLGFLGLGSQPPTADLGRMVAFGKDYLMQAWWISTFPGLAILILVLGFNLLGDGLRDALDPQLRRIERA